MRDSHRNQKQEEKKTREVLKIVAVDKRPKCQPIGAEVDCRLDDGTRRERLLINVVNYFQVRIRSEAESWGLVRTLEV